MMFRYPVAMVLILAIAGAASADELMLQNGSKLIGTIQKRVDETWLLDTPFAGEVKVKVDQVRSIRTERKLNVRLQSGATYQGALSVNAQGQTTVPGEDGQPVVIPVAEIRWLWLPGEEDPEVAAKILAEKKAAGIWEVSLALGMNGQTGNSEQISASMRFDALRTKDRERLKFYALAQYSEDNGVRSANEILGGVNLEVDDTVRTYWYLKSEAEFDEFEQIDLRVTTTAGKGVFLIKEELEELKVRGGIGYQHQNFDTGAADQTSDDIIGEVGVDYMRKIVPWLLFKSSTNYLPTLDRADDFRITSDNTAEIPISPKENVRFKLGVRWDYKAMPPAGVDRLDTYYFALLTFDLSPQ